MYLFDFCHSPIVTVTLFRISLSCVHPYLLPCPCFLAVIFSGKFLMRAPGRTKGKGNIEELERKKK